MKLNIAPLCRAFKRHSPARHVCWTLFCRESYRPRPHFLCRHCRKYRGPEQIRPLARRGPFAHLGLRARFCSIDEAHNIGDGEKIARAIELGASKKPEETDREEADK